MRVLDSVLLWLLLHYWLLTTGLFGSLPGTLGHCPCDASSELVSLAVSDFQQAKVAWRNIHRCGMWTGKHQKICCHALISWWLCALSTEFVKNMSWAIQKFDQQNPLIRHDLQSCSAQFNPSQCALEPCSSVTKLETVAKAGSSAVLSIGPLWFVLAAFLQGACLRACLVRQGGKAFRLSKCMEIGTVFCLACLHDSSKCCLYVACTGGAWCSKTIAGLAQWKSRLLSWIMAFINFATKM